LGSGSDVEVRQCRGPDSAEAVLGTPTRTIEELGDGVMGKGLEGEGSGPVEDATRWEQGVPPGDKVGVVPARQQPKAGGRAQCVDGGGRGLSDRRAKGTDTWSPRLLCRFKPSQTENRVKRI
jgi:hypothetical protein